ncbi:MAG: hypothetical protein FJX74_19935, partial [Armatimonadetes bacterium]|nr:hypothetical protein [Armatimonadota bacterium]
MGDPPLKPEPSAVFAGVDDENSLSLTPYVEAVSRHRRWLLIGFGAGVLGAIVYLLIARPLYEAQTTLVVKEESAAPTLPSAASAMSALVGAGSTGNLGTEVEILESSSRLAHTTRFVACQQIVEAITGRPVELIGALTVGVPT